MNRCEALRTVSGTNWRLINVSCYITAHRRLGWVTYEREALGPGQALPTSALSLPVPLSLERRLAGGQSRGCGDKDSDLGSATSCLLISGDSGDQSQPPL